MPDSEERLILREEFTSRMHQRFLDGKDGGFDYRCHLFPAQHPWPWATSRSLSILTGPPLVGLDGSGVVPHHES